MEYLNIAYWAGVAGFFGVACYLGYDLWINDELSDDHIYYQIGIALLTLLCILIWPYVLVFGYLLSRVDSPAISAAISDIAAYFCECVENVLMYCENRIIFIRRWFRNNLH